MTTKQQKIEGDWEEAKGKLIKSISSSWEYMSEEKVNETVKDWSEFIDKLFLPILSQSQASERQRCVEALPKKIKISADDRSDYHEMVKDWVSRLEGFNEAIDQAKHNLKQLK